MNELKILGNVVKREEPSKNFQKQKKEHGLLLKNGYLGVYARNNKYPKSYKEDQRMFEPSVWYGILSSVNTNIPTSHGTLMGQLETKNDNNPALVTIKKNAQFIDFIDICC